MVLETGRRNDRPPMTAGIETLWLRLCEILMAVSERLAILSPALIRDIGWTANAALLVRGYLAFKKHSDGDEVAITIDIQSDGKKMTVESDVCTDGGDVISTGPAVTISLSESQSNVDIELRWLCEFENFLIANESVLVKALAELS